MVCQEMNIIIKFTMNQLESQLESLLFVSAKPMTVKQLADLSQAEESAVESACEALSSYYNEAKSGLDLVKNNHKYQMVTRADNAEAVKAYLGSEINSELSRPSLETLTIIAYRGPIVKSDLDKIRGINCSMIIRNLLLRGLIEAKGNRNDGETSYEVSFDFLKFLGVNDLQELPDYQRLNSDPAIGKFLGQDSEAETDDTEPDEARVSDEETNTESL
jgi:segregation and condensation protein B